MGKLALLRGKPYRRYSASRFERFCRWLIEVSYGGRKRH